MRKILVIACLFLSGCATLNDDLFNKYGTFLTGGSVAPGVDGHLYGSGTAEAWVGQPPLALCYQLFVQKIGTPSAAHLHRGREHVVGPEVIVLKAPTDGESLGCARLTRRLRAEIEAEPEAFYIDVHTPEFPQGALRGQLRRQSPNVRARG